MKKVLFVIAALLFSISIEAQELEKIDNYPTGYINGAFMNKYKSIDGVLYAIGYETTQDWILVRYPAGCRNTTYTVHPNCRRIARGAFQGASYLKVIYLPESVSYIGEDAFADCTSLQGICYGDEATHVKSVETNDEKGNTEIMARYNLAGLPCSPSDKGIQIIVYSDYTTKTIIVE